MKLYKYMHEQLNIKKKIKNGQKINPNRHFSKGDIQMAKKKRQKRRRDSESQIIRKKKNKKNKSNKQKKPEQPSSKVNKQILERV